MTAVVRERLVSNRELSTKLVDILARVLHYQDRGEPDWVAMDYAATKREMDSLPQEVIERYRNDLQFYRQVQRAVAMVRDAVNGREAQ